MSGTRSTELTQLLLMLVSVSCLAVAGCGCDEEDPTIAVVNDMSGEVSAYVEASDGTTLEIVGVESGATTREQTIPSGLTKLALIWGEIPVPFYCDLQAEYCYDYEIRFTGDIVRIVPIER